MTDSGFCSYTNPSRATIPLIRPHQCDSEGGRIRGVLLYYQGYPARAHTRNSSFPVLLLVTQIRAIADYTTQNWAIFPTRVVLRLYIHVYFSYIHSSFKLSVTFKFPPDFYFSGTPIEPIKNHLQDIYNLYYYSSPVRKNLSSKFDEFLPGRSQFDTNHDQIWQACADRSGNGSYLNTLAP